MEPYVERFDITTKRGNTLHFIYNKETNVLIVDLIEKNGVAENQFIWCYIDEKAMLEEELKVS